MPIAVLLLVVQLVLLAISYYFARLVIFPKVTPFAETQRLALEWGWVTEEKYTPWPKEEFTIRSPYGYDLSAIYHPVPGSRKTVVLTHGITFSRYGMVKYASMFYERGWNVLLYDIRHHGQSGGPNTTFGHFEKYDLKAVVDWAFDRLGPGGIVGTVGESLGAATTLQHAAIDPRIAFAIADCSYSSLFAQLAYRARVEYRLPAFPLVYLAALWVWIMSGMRMSKVAPVKDLPNIETPIFFVHGKEDTYIPPKMSIDMYRAKTKGVRKLYLAPDANHAESVVKNPLEYDQKVGEFLQEIGL